MASHANQKPERKVPKLKIPDVQYDAISKLQNIKSEATSQSDYYGHVMPPGKTPKQASEYED